MSEEEMIKRLLNGMPKDILINTNYTLYKDSNLKDLEIKQLQDRINRAIKYIKKCGGMELINDYSFPEKPIIDKEAKTNLLNILKGNDKE